MSVFDLRQWMAAAEQAGELERVPGASADLEIGAASQLNYEVGLSGNGELQRTLYTLGLRTLQFRHLSLSQPGQIQRSVADHRRLLTAYEERDKTAATGMPRALIMGGYRAIQRSGLVGADAPPVRFHPGTEPEAGVSR